MRNSWHLPADLAPRLVSSFPPRSTLGPQHPAPPRVQCRLRPRRGAEPPSRAEGAGSIVGGQPSYRIDGSELTTSARRALRASSAARRGRMWTSLLGQGSDLPLSRLRPTQQHRPARQLGSKWRWAKTTRLVWCPKASFICALRRRLPPSATPFRRSVCPRAWRRNEARKAAL